ncbi:MAG: SRPBCC family protein [bacterium]
MAAGSIEAQARLEARPGEVFDYLARLENHWRLMDASVDVLSLDGDGAAGPDRSVVRMHGPLGIGRVAHTRVLELDRPRLLRGVAEIGPRADGGRRTEGEVSWRLQPDGSGTRVTLTARVTRAGATDRVLLALGGRAWMAARFGLALRHLAARYSAEPIRG